MFYTYTDISQRGKNNSSNKDHTEMIPERCSGFTFTKTVAAATYCYRCCILF